MTNYTPSSKRASVMMKLVSFFLSLHDRIETHHRHKIWRKGEPSRCTVDSQGRESASIFMCWSDCAITNSFFFLLSSRITFLIIIIKSPCFFFLLYATEHERKKEEKRHTHYCRNAFRLAAEAAEHLRKKKKEYLYDRSKETNQRGLDDAVRF